MMEPHKPANSPTEVITYQRKPSWAHELIQDAQKYGAPSKTLEKAKDLDFIPTMLHLCLTLLMQNLPAMKKLLRCGMMP